VDITATFELQGTDYEWKWYATDVALAMAIAGLTERVHGRTDPSAADDYDFTPLIGGRWVAVNPLWKAKDLTNNEAVHMALALQTILQKVADGSWIVDDEDSPIDRWLSKTPCREQVELLDAYVQQAQIAGNFDLIIEHLKEAADKHNGLMGEDRFFGRFGINSYFFEVPAGAGGVGSSVADGSVEERVGSTVADGSDDGSGDDTSSDSDDDDSDNLPEMRHRQPYNLPENCTIYEGRVYKDVANPRRPRYPGQSVDVKSEHRKGHRVRQGCGTCSVKGGDEGGGC
jgi:hypothetical protein